MWGLARSPWSLDLPAAPKGKYEEPRE